MFNRELFRAAYIKKGHTAREVAQILGINETTLYRKTNGASDFTRNEIQLFKAAYGLTSEDVDAIFFA